MMSLNPTKRVSSSASLLLAGVAGLVLWAGCGQGLGPDPEVDRQEIEATIREYLPALARAYATGDVRPLKDLTVPKEMSRIQRRAEELAGQGQVYEPELKEVTVEKVETWQYANAAATTLEVWDVRSYTTGSHVLLNEVTDQKNRVVYQLKRKEHGWVILYRELTETLDS